MFSRGGFQKGTEAEREEKQSARVEEGCSLSSDDGFVTDCYITPTSENRFYCDEPPNLLPHLQRKHGPLFSFKTGFHFTPTTTDSWADWQQRKPITMIERKQTQRHELQS